MPALSAMRYNPAIAALATLLKSRGPPKTKKNCLASDPKPLVPCLRLLKTGKTLRCPKTKGM